MTVAGKGGRPRKWRSDGDRSRAFRARQQGRTEPSTLAAALDDGDALAKVLDQMRVLREELLDARQSERSAREELGRARQIAADQAARFGWLEHENERLRVTRDGLIVERDALAVELDQLRADGSPPVGSGVVRAPVEMIGTVPEGVSRAERRRREREQERRHER